MPARSALVLVTKDSFVSIFANLKNNDVAHVEFKVPKTSFKKGADFLSISIEIIPTRLQNNASEFFGVEFITTISKFRKRKFLHRLVTSSLKYKIRHFHVVVEKERQKMYKKAWCCFSHSTYRFFDIFVLVAIVAMCVLSLSCFLGLPILGFRHVTRRSCLSTKQYNSPPPPPPPYQRRQPLNVFLSPNVAAWKTANYKA